MGRGHWLGAAPHQEEHRLAAPPPGRVADDVARSLRRRERRLARPEHEAVGSLPNRFLRACTFATGNLKEITQQSVMLGS
jgi:hypothetical protein